MTGYGKSNFESDNMSITAEIRTLNSKQLDINMRVSSLLKQKELKIRNILSKRLLRGKVDLFLTFHSHNLTEAPGIDRELVGHYFQELKKVHDSFKQDAEPDYLSMILKMPDVLVSQEATLDGNSWVAVQKIIEETIDKVDGFRLHEGEILKQDFIQRIRVIMELLTKVDPLEKSRIQRIKERIQKHLNEYLSAANANPERLEQEMIYYIEKLDITEEKIRLKKHCDYFLNVLNNEENSGKKLIFVTQEIGREINTLGSKANDADLQRMVVLMKDELEKIKEQLFNIL